MTVLAVMIAFLCGSLPFSSWMAGAAGKDIGKIGDGNPGAANVFRTGNKRLGVAALLLDYLKAFLPVYISILILEPAGVSLILLAIAPFLGHAFMPWRGFKGGKGVNVTFGIWTALTLWVVPVSLGLGLAFLVLFFRKIPDAWKVILGMAVALPGLYWMGAPWEFWLVYALNFLLLVFTHRKELLSGVGERGGRDAS